MKLICFCMLMWLAASVNTHTYAQTKITDSTSQQYAFNYAITDFNTKIGKGSRLYNGQEYYFYDPLIKGNAYFLDVKAFSPGSVVYDGTSFSAVPMLYDIYKDELVTILYNQYSKYQLVKEKVSSFDFLDHHFINITTDGRDPATGIKAGFYEVLYSGKTRVLAKRSKDIQATTSTQISESYFNLKKAGYFIGRDDRYYPVSSQQDVLNVFSDHKKEVQRYLKTNNLKYRKGAEEFLTAAAAYYDSITN